MKKDEFAVTLYAKRENAGTDEEYLETSTDIDYLAEIGETIMVAEYRLVDVRPVKVSVTR